MTLNFLFQPETKSSLIDLPVGSINKVKLRIQLLSLDEGFVIESQDNTTKNSPSSTNILFYPEPTPGFNPEDTETIYVWLYS